MLAMATLALVGCGRDAASVDAPVPRDAEVDAPPDARSLGILDGDCAGQPGMPRVLVYSYENQWRHLSNYYARLAIYNMCAQHGFTVRTTNDPRAINSTRLADTDVLVFAVTSGSGLDAQSKADVEAWVRAGGGVVGFEAATATEQAWPFHVENMGAEFLGHPPGVQAATVRIDTSHPITAGLTPELAITEQWYTFKGRPEDVPGQRVLMTLDEDTLPADFPSELEVGYHAITWVHERFGGREFYTALGDLPSTFEDPLVLEVTARAIRWTARQL